MHPGWSFLSFALCVATSHGSLIFPTDETCDYNQTLDTKPCFRINKIGRFTCGYLSRCCWHVERNECIQIVAPQVVTFSREESGKMAEDGQTRTEALISARSTMKPYLATEKTMDAGDNNTQNSFKVNDKEAATDDELQEKDISKSRDEIGEFPKTLERSEPVDVNRMLRRERVQHESQPKQQNKTVNGGNDVTKNFTGVNENNTMGSLEEEDFAESSGDIESWRIAQELSPLVVDREQISNREKARQERRMEREIRQRDREERRKNRARERKAKPRGRRRKKDEDTESEARRELTRRTKTTALRSKFMLEENGDVTSGMGPEQDPIEQRAKMNEVDFFPNDKPNTR